MNKKTFFSSSEIQEFKEKGFVIVRNLFNEVEMSVIKRILITCFLKSLSLESRWYI